MVLLPHIRAALASRLQPKQQPFLVELDRIKQVRACGGGRQGGYAWDATTNTATTAAPSHVCVLPPPPYQTQQQQQEYQEHHEKILAKFVAMIGDLLSHAAAHSDIRTRDWDDMAATATAGSSGGRCFVEDVIKGVCTMHRVLHQLLPPAQVQDVFSRIVALLARRLAGLYLGDDDDSQTGQSQPQPSGPQQPRTTAGHQRRVDEVTHLVTSLGLLRGVDAGPLARLEGRVREQQLAFQQQAGDKGGAGAPFVGAAPSPSASAPSS